LHDIRESRYLYNGRVISRTGAARLPPRVFPDGSVWKLQGLWSNAAYGTGSGAPNLGGQKGCVWD